MADKEKSLDTDTTRLLARAEEQLPVPRGGVGYSGKDRTDTLYRLAQGKKEVKLEKKAVEEKE